MMQVFRALAAGLSMSASLAVAVPPTNAELEAACAQAEDAAHCGRLVEAMQMQRLPNLARREGRTLTVSLFPSGSATFADSEDVIQGRSYSLWDYLDGLNAVLLYTTQGDNVSFTLVQRASNRRVELPTEPQLAPDRRRLVTADVCERRCSNEIAVWRVSPEAIRKELAWPADASWLDAGAKWKDAETLTIEYTRADGSGTVERTLTDPTWKRIP
jgi:hypothetical protein